jgi:hypothetical protein
MLIQKNNQACAPNEACCKKNCIIAKIISRTILSLCVLFFVAGICFAENIVFPSTSSVKSVKDFGARGNGTNDDTDAFKSAVRQAMHKIIYIPNGTYRLTDRIVFQENTNATSGVGPWIYGQSRDGVIIKLDNNAQGFGNAESPKALMQTCPRDIGNDPSADFFMRNIRNITINTGNNAGAIGIRYFSNNTGSLRNVRIVGNGAVGLDLGWLDNNGPCYVADVEIDGFDIGINSDFIVHSQTLSRITIKNCRTYGIRHDEQVLTIEDLVVENTPMAAYTSGGVLTIVNATFTGSDPNSPSIYHNDIGMIYLRNITAKGFLYILEGDVGGDIDGEYIAEYASHGVVKKWDNSGSGMLNLPVKKEPEIEWEQDMSNWVSVNAYNPGAGDGRDDAGAFQRAIDNAAANNKTTVYINSTGSRGYDLKTNVRVYGSVRHIIGLGYTRIYGPAGFIIENTDAPTVTFQHIYSFGGPARFYENKSSSTIHVQETDGARMRCNGPGDVFLTGFVGTVAITNSQAHVWARQLNMETGGGINADNQGGFLWALGSKTERNGIKYGTSDGGVTEFFGGSIWLGIGAGNKDTPMFTIHDAHASFANIRQVIIQNCKPYSCYYERFVEERRDGDTRTFRADESFALDRFSVYAGYDRNNASIPVEEKGPDMRAASPAFSQLNGRSIFKGPARIEIISLSGKQLVAREIGEGAFVNAVRGLASGAYVVRVQKIAAFNAHAAPAASTYRLFVP